MRNSPHREVMREAAACGRMKRKQDPAPTPAQLRMLAKVPDELTHFMFGSFGVRSILGNQTVRVLAERGWIEVLTMPPRWRRTDAGRRVVTSHQSAEKK